MRKEVELLEDHAELGARASELLALLRQRLALNEDLARIDGLEAVDSAAQRRLAGSGRADDDEDLSPIDLKVDVLQDVQGAVVLVDVA